MLHCITFKNVTSVMSMIVSPVKFSHWLRSAKHKETANTIQIIQVSQTFRLSFHIYRQKTVMLVAHQPEGRSFNS
jgi:hypothetical protein